MKLVSAESDAPRMKVVGKPEVSGKRAWVRLRCPSTEQTGPCQGLLEIRFAGRKAAVGSSHFRVQPGKAKPVRVKLNRRVKGDKGDKGDKGRAILRIKAKDRLGNTSYSVRKANFR